MSDDWCVCPKCEGMGTETVLKTVPWRKDQTLTYIDHVGCSLCEGKAFVSKLIAFEYKLANYED